MCSSSMTMRIRASSCRRPSNTWGRELAWAIGRLVSAKPDRYADSSAETDEHLPLVLIVDDNDDHRIMLALYIRAAGFRVIEATDGTSAVGKARRTRLDVVLLDLDMPGVSGWQACRWLKSSLDTPTVGFIAPGIVTTQAECAQCRNVRTVFGYKPPRPS